ncbi:MAG: CDP-glycerol glycerophosphotransferase family protein [Coriobacteriia bacterium]|nr:CDP-glycerol glycerophosphotransferase family protein [Coriobacteriia bacterium]
MRTLIRLAIYVARAIYAVLRVLPRRAKIVMLSRQSDEPSKDLVLLAEQLRRQAPDIDVVVRCRFIPKDTLGRALYLSEVLVQMYHLATARACVVDGYNVPLSILNHHGNLFVVQLWHALGGIKQFGYQSIGQPGGRSAAIARAMHMHRNYDVVLCGGPGSVAAFAAAFEVDPTAVVPLGLPRVDYLRGARTPADGARPAQPVAALVRAYPHLTDGSTRVVLYAPTFRHHGGSAYREVIDAFADSGMTLIVKPHDLESASLTGAHLVDATGVDVFDLLPLCDAVITDYSAVAFEAACIDKPVYYYVYDIEEYRAERGLNFDPLAEIPAMSSTSIDDVIRMIRESVVDEAAVSDFSAAFVPERGADCTASIADLVLSHVRERS